MHGGIGTDKRFRQPAFDKHMRHQRSRQAVSEPEN